MKKPDVIDNFDLTALPGDHLVSKLDLKQMRVLCSMLRNEIIDATSKHGGHLSSNLGVVELMVALHHFFDFSKDKLILDVGHQCYAHKLLSGRSLEHLREKGGVSGFQKMHESIYDPYEAGHSSTSISAAEAFALSRDIKKEHYDVVALIGDGSIVNGLALEALNSLGSKNTKAIIILNDNDMSISQPVGGMGRFFSKISTSASYTKMKHGYRRILTKTKFGEKVYFFSKSVKDSVKRKLVPPTMFDHMGYNYIGPIDGHDIKAILKALERAKRSDRSVVLHVNTVKGHGYPPSEGDKQGKFHDVGPFNKEDGTPISSGEDHSWSGFYAGEVNATMAMNEKAYLIVAATQVGSKLTATLEQFKERSIDVGIAEEHALTFAGAMYLSGFHPIVSLYSTFLQRAYDELHHDCARIKAGLTLLIDRAGLVGGNGETHQGVYDVAMLSSIPGVTIAMPSNRFDAHQVYSYAMAANEITAIRYPKEDIIEAKEYKFKGKRFHFLNLNDQKDAIIVCVGPKVYPLVEALKQQGLDSRYEVVDPIYLYPFSDEDIALLSQYNRIIIYDAYGIRNGFATLLEVRLMDEHYQGRIDVYAVPNEFLYLASAKELEEDLGLSIPQILAKIA